MAPPSSRRINLVVSELHRALEESGDLDSDSREALELALDDIKDALSDDSGEPASGGRIGQRLAELVDRFEGRHPRLTGLVGRAADALAELGL